MKIAASDALNKKMSIVKKVEISQSKNIEKATMDAVLKEVALEVWKWKRNKMTERQTTYGVMNAIIKKTSAC